MNYKEAKEIVDCRERTICKHQSIDVARAECYLKAHAKAQKLVEALENIQKELGVPQPGYIQPVANAYYLSAEALDQWHKENKE